VGFSLCFIVVLTLKGNSTMETITMTKSEAFALGEWLSEWPENWSYRQVIDWLLNNDDYHYSEDEDDQRVWVWEPMEDFSGTQVVEYIENTRRHFERFTSD
jgi:hypothetical protein